MHRTLMVGRLTPGGAPHIADLFAESDNNTALPKLIGVHSRSLFHYGEVYLHFTESEEPIRDSLAAHLDHPDFRQLSLDLRPHISPYDPTTWRSCLDGMAQQFYRWDAKD